MDYFLDRNGEVYCEDLSLTDIAQQFGTPSYVYSLKTLRLHCQEFIKAFHSFPTLVCFAIKANSTVGFIKEIFSQGLGADIVSGGELERCLVAGLAPSKIVFSGVGKLATEIARAIKVGIYCFNVESLEELNTINRLAQSAGKRVNISLRINPNIDALTHPKIATGLHSTKFGMGEEIVSQIPTLFGSLSSLRLIGIACHIGSQIVDLAPIREAATRMGELVGNIQAMGIQLDFLGMGGGLGIRYHQESPPSISEYASILMKTAETCKISRLVVEPGRVIAGNAGILLSRVISVKTNPLKQFIILDASMSELIRPALYDAYHEILPVLTRTGLPIESFDMVGPVCETGDCLGRDRKLVRPSANDLYYIRSCGAYGSSMASNYNTRPRPAEVMVDGKIVREIKKREEFGDLLRLER